MSIDSTTVLPGVAGLLDALRDRRTLTMVLLSSVAMGPLMLLLMSTLASDFEKRAEAREAVAVGMAHAPSLQNFLARQTWTVRDAPSNYEQQLESSQLGDPVLVLADDFEAQLAAGEQPLVQIVTSSANQRASGAVGKLEHVLREFSREQVALRLMVRGVAPSVLQPLEVAQRDLANPAARAARLTGMLPFFVLMAVMYGALTAALDSTAGERERGSLEPLLMNPAARFAIVLGKWGAVASVGMMIAVLSCLSFLPGQWLLRSPSLAAMFRYGWPEALGFLALLLPLAGALAALLMAIAIRGKTVKEAQASSAMLVMVVSLLPMITLMNQEGDKPWHLWVPALAQSTLMTRVLKGEVIAFADLLLPALVCLALALLCLWAVVRQLGRAAVK